jgi:hypothetical protein
MERLTLHQALDIFEENTPDIKNACIDNIAFIIESHPEIETTNPTYDEVANEVRRLVVINKVVPIQKVVRVIERRKRKPRPVQITDLHIERAREYPIEQLWEELVGEPIRQGMTRCCFHDDNTASMSLRRHNRYYCFGCGEKGDTIDLYMKLNKCTFVQAVKKIQ